MKFQGFVGPTYSLKSSNVNAERCVNLYPELIEAGTGKEGEVAYLTTTPGLEKILNVGTGPIRCVHIDPQGTVFVVSGTELYKMIYSASAWTATSLTKDIYSTFTTSTGRVYAASMANASAVKTVFVDGDSCYIYEKSGIYPEGNFATYAAYGYSSVNYPTHVIFIDGYFIFVQGGSNQFFVSDINTFTVNPLSFSSAEGDPDDVMAIISNNRDLWVLGERTIEVFSNTGNADFPFERVSGGFIEKGCAAKYSVAKGDGNVFWVGRDEAGHGVVYAARGLSPQRISTHAVEAAFKKYADITVATGFTYQQGGHYFYVLNFPEGTWVYDLSTRLWHERSYTNLVSLERHRAENHIFVPSLGIHLVGDYATSAVYKLNEDYYSDDGNEITRMRCSPHVSGGLDRLFCNSFKLDIEAGVGLDGIKQGSDPQIMLDFSDDGGHTWSSENWVSIGQVGEYKKRICWRRLGKFRDRIFRVKITDPVKVNILAAEIDVEQGAS